MVGFFVVVVVIVYFFFFFSHAGVSGWKIVMPTYCFNFTSSDGRNIIFVHLSESYTKRISVRDLNTGL